MNVSILKNRGTADAGMKLRFERKYLLDRDTALLLRQRMSYALKPDGSNPSGKYKVSSIYFDDRHNTAFFEKQNGVTNREKLRIRYYNDDMDKIQLERKIKHGEMVSKEREALTARQYDMMCRGDYSFMKEQVSGSGKTPPLFERFYSLHLMKCMRPVVAIDYDRQAYVFEPGNVRITFDSGISAKAPLANQSFGVLPDSNVILEVKYDHFLPTFITSLLSGFQPTQQLALSKYVMSKLVMQGR